MTQEKGYFEIIQIREKNGFVEYYDCGAFGTFEEAKEEADKQYDMLTSIEKTYNTVQVHAHITKDSSEVVYTAKERCGI